jgi:hypothetical protein
MSNLAPHVRRSAGLERHTAVMSPSTAFLDLLAEEIDTAELAAVACERQGVADMAESWRRRADHLRLYLEGDRLAQTGPSPGLG